MTRIHQDGGVFIVEIDGPLRADTVDSIDELLAPKLTGRLPSVLVDLGRVPSLDSRGLSWLLDLSEECRRRGGCLRLCGVGELCADLLRVTGVGATIECFPDQSSALACYA